MNTLSQLEPYAPFAVLLAWFAYRWWSAQRVKAGLPGLKQQGATLVDVRSAQEYLQAHAPGTINIPLQQLGARLSEIPRSQPVVVCCASGTRSAMALLLLKKNGFARVLNAGSWTQLVD
ncbi:rhodanese-like domain-containing protein [Rhodoferax sp.]|uniref:rhodanese-like domain-containing protein n=1 Tax=Rhodoferax sp. TaxID=50421 RepID=UPI0025FEB51E|nr:rhodanese-like domain-containing protein [Rhodoferax sp.]